MITKDKYAHLAPDLAETLRRMDKVYEKAIAGLPSLEQDPEFILMGLRAEVIEQVEAALEAEGLTRADLARTMGVSRAYISKILNEKVNFQMETIAKLAVALDRDIALRLIRKTEKVVVAPARKAAEAAKRLKAALEEPTRPPRIPASSYKQNTEGHTFIGKVVTLNELYKKAA